MALVDSQYLPRGRAWQGVATLSAFYAIATLDRVILSMMIGPIKADLGINDFQVGLLIGLSFALTYVVFGVPFGLLADRYPRRWIIMAGLMIWSLATIGCGFVAGFAALFLMRMLVGLGEAALSPAAIPLIADWYPPEKRSLPLSLYQAATHVGSALSLISGGLLIDRLSHAGERIHFWGDAFYGWQMVFFIVGIPGCLLGLLALGLPEVRKGAPASRPAATARIWPFVARHKRLFFFFLLAFAANVTLNYAFAYWSAEHLYRKLGWSKSEIGLALGLLLLAPSLISHAITGSLVDRMTARRVDDAPLRLFFWMALISLPFGILAYATASPTLAIGSLLALKLFLIPSLGFAATSLQLFTPRELRGRVTGLFLSVVNFAGLAIGPALVGFLTHYVWKDDAALGAVLSTMMGTGISIISICLYFSLKPMREAVAEARKEASTTAAGTL
jgi:MFS family permease